MKTLSANYATELVKLTDKLDEIFINLGFSTGAKGMESFIAYLWVIVLYFSLKSGPIAGMLELGKVRLIWKFN